MFRRAKFAGRFEPSGPRNRHTRDNRCVPHRQSGCTGLSGNAGCAGYADEADLVVGGHQQITRQERVAYNKWTAIREFTRELVVDAIADSRR